MKKFVLSFAVMLAVGLSAAIAGENPEINPKAIASFKKSFASAESVAWSVEGDYSKVSFVLGGTRVVAVFNTDGELLGSVRGLTYSQLPLTVISSLDKQLANTAIYDIREVSNGDGTRYKFTMERKGRKYVVTVTPDGTVEQTVKVRK
jgi:hypothetical protein